MIKKIFSIQALLWLALLLALAGSLRHVAHTFTSVDANVVWGWVQAIAVDAGLFALALGITQRRRVKRGTRALWFGVTLFSAISIFANLTYGLAHVSELPQWIIVSKPYILAGALPILVLYLAEVVGSDVSHALDEAEKERRKEERERQKELEKSQRNASTTGISATPEAAERARLARQAQSQDKKEQLLVYYFQHPNATQEEAGTHVERSRQWVSATLAEMEAKGDIKRDGRGVEVVKEVA